MFDREALRQVLQAERRAVRVVVAAVEGSGPREVGAAMLVGRGGQSGTIGGGALEWQAVLRARSLLVSGGARIDREALGPALDQCCGGAVTLVTEVYAAGPEGAVVARALDGSAMPLAVSRMLAAARGQGVMPAPQLIHGWMVEPVSGPRRQVWVWGAGHVGRALVAVLSPLPEIALTWVDIAAERFPEASGVRVLPVPDPADAVALAPPEAEHLIVTFSHALDLELCHRLLRHGFASCGLIGSATKWARFRSRLRALGHDEARISRITCPIGQPALGKHPHSIAIGVAAEVLARKRPYLDTFEKHSNSSG